MRLPFDRSPRFAAFWPFYVAQHLDPTCRALHCAGTGLALLLIGCGLLGSRRWLLLAPVAGYGLSWAGHVLFERNRPAAFRHPLLSLAADLRMFVLTLSGRMGPHLDRARQPPEPPR
ncbi:MAG: DUF962 domain-containing protein [Myxococcales bacterium]|nr:DUF962 domain-containing protein [Myxococcota bacterium]MDW8283977.1 DUF962 domain-containing protein [Myxococcales bacterium]